MSDHKECPSPSSAGNDRLVLDAEKLQRIADDAEEFEEKHGALVLIGPQAPRELTPEEEIAVWREWFAKAGSGWDDVEDIEMELREMRGMDDEPADDQPG